MTCDQPPDVEFSVVAVLDRAGRIRERVEYTPYGVAMNQPLGDFDGSNAASINDIYGDLPPTGFLTAFFTAQATADWNRSGLPATQQDIFDFLADYFDGQTSNPRVPLGTLSDAGVIDNPERGSLRWSLIGCRSRRWAGSSGTRSVSRSN